MGHGGWRISVLVGVLVIAMAPAAASAGLVTFTSEAAFLAAAGDVSLESFENEADRSLSTAPIVVPSFTMTPKGGVVDLRSSPLDGHFPTDGRKYVSFGVLASSAPGTLEFELALPATSFGLTVTDFGDVNLGTMTIATDVGEASGGLVVASTPPLLTNGNVLFFGFVQDVAFRKVRLTLSMPADGIGVDEVYFRTVPEPNSLVLMSGFGVAVVLGAGGRTIRRRMLGGGGGTGLGRAVAVQ